MVGTASDIYINNDNGDTELYGFVMFSKWLLGKDKAKCLLLEIDQNGCNILMPASLPMPPRDFKLIIMAPGEEKRVQALLTARLHWVDGEFSARHKKLNCSFVNLDISLADDINFLKTYLDNDLDEKYISCNILKC